MSELSDLDIPRPRPDELCKRIANKIDPWWGFAIAGVLFLVCGLVISVLAMITIEPKLGIEERSTAAQISGVVTLVIGIGGAWMAFRAWRGRRVGAKRALVRDGELVEATVARRVRTIGRSRKYANAFALTTDDDRSLECAFNLWFLPHEGSKIRMLYKPATSTVLAFDDSGRMFVGQVQGVLGRLL